MLPPTSNLNFTTGQVVANAAFVGAGIVQQHHAVRLSTSADAWFLLDITGGLTTGRRPDAAGAGPACTRAANGRVALVDKVRQALGRTS